MSDKPPPPEPDKQNSGVSIGDVTGGIHGSIIAGRDVYYIQGDTAVRPGDTAVRDPQFRRNRRKMLERVWNTWKDLLETSPYRFARIELGLQTKLDAVERPYDRLVQRSKQAPQVLLSGTSMSQIFTDAGNALLILGKPGAGKTTLLLELTRGLLERAKQDEDHLIPVVFHLASWAEQRLALADWLTDELNKQYDVPRKLAKTWIDAGLILPLLDGLDEVTAHHRETCVETINAFIREHGLLPLVVCSRVADYKALTVRLRLPSAVIIRSLSRQQVQHYVEQAGASLTGLRTVLQADKHLWKLLNTPLMLSVVAVAYQGRSPDEIHATGTLEERRTRIFAAYTDAMFARRAKRTPYTREQTKHWLTWLARAMKDHDKPIFYLERMQPDWLSGRRQQRLVTFITSVMNGLFFGLLFGLFGGISGGLVCGLFGGLSVGIRNPFIGGLLYGLFFGPLIGMTIGSGYMDAEAGVFNGVFGGVLGGLLFGLFGGVTVILVGHSKGIKPVEKLRWSWSATRDKWMNKLFKRLLWGSLWGSLFGLVPFFVQLVWNVDLDNEPLDLLLGGLRVGLFFGLVSGLVGGLLDGFTVGNIRTKSFPNQGIKRSVRNAAISGLVIALASGLVDKMFFELGEGYGLSIGMLCGLIFGLRFGGRACLHHFALRLVLWGNNFAPLNYVYFLNYATARIFLHKVGGGYVFVHRMLLEYFAALEQTSTK